MSDLFSNPWFYIIIALSVVSGNIMLLKYTANMKFPQKKDNNKSTNDDEKKLK